VIKVILEILVCWMINTVVQECWSPPVVIVVCPVLQETEHDRESVSPDKIKKHYSGYHRPLASKPRGVNC